MHVLCPHVLRSFSHADLSSWNPLQRREALHQLQHTGDLNRPLARKDSADDAVLGKDLGPLRHARGKLAPALDLFQVRRERLSGSQWTSQDIGCRHRILYSQIDTHAADW